MPAYPTPRSKVPFPSEHNPGHFLTSHEASDFTLDAEIYFRHELWHWSDIMDRQYDSVTDMFTELEKARGELAANNLILSDHGGLDSIGTAIGHLEQEWKKYARDYTDGNECDKLRREFQVKVDSLEEQIHGLNDNETVGTASQQEIRNDPRKIESKVAGGSQTSSPPSPEQRKQRLDGTPSPKVRASRGLLSATKDRKRNSDKLDNEVDDAESSDQENLDHGPANKKMKASVRSPDVKKPRGQGRQNQKTTAKSGSSGRDGFIRKFGQEKPQRECSLLPDSSAVSEAEGLFDDYQIVSEDSD
ncbi:hypothetical protein EJ08DRAFT_718462 [Tothia fuscella]|uniref:Uncharacterized protein n=1 Tax=Tothia fuscella TaxID=1048955 RepID=A0A9P4NNP6_9PEZI|nr:hypothetical protein EJ08DRAFT_718462 [Tothia fuscella]